MVNILLVGGLHDPGSCDFGPTTLNRPGNDAGTRYRRAIFVHSPGQELAAKQMVAKLAKDKMFGGAGDPCCRYVIDRLKK